MGFFNPTSNLFLKTIFETATVNFFKKGCHVSRHKMPVPKVQIVILKAHYR
jgi:hypothetical protein